jgi:hypothetical protein
LLVAIVIDEGLELQIGNGVLSDPEGVQVHALHACAVAENPGRDLNPGDIGNAHHARLDCWRRLHSFQNPKKASSDGGLSLTIATRELSPA